MVLVLLVGGFAALEAGAPLPCVGRVAGDAGGCSWALLLLHGRGVPIG